MTMIPIPSQPLGRQAAPVMTTESARIVRLRVAFSGRYIDGAEQIDKRLQAHVRPASTH